LNINRYWVVLVIFCAGLTGKLHAQSAYQAGLLPAININAKLSDQWSLNLKSESRQRLLFGITDGERVSKYSYVLTDFSFIAARKVGLSGRIAGGYLIRFFHGEIIHRSIQQYTYVQNLSGFRLAHRVVADQTFSPIEANEFRFRYRLASEIPLNGESADPKEFYLKLSNEYLNSLQDSDYDLEVRVVALMGYSLTDKQKIEFGLDYRLSSFLNQVTRHSFWTSINWYIDF